MNSANGKYHLIVSNISCNRKTFEYYAMTMKNDTLMRNPLRVVINAHSSYLRRSHVRRKKTYISARRDNDLYLEFACLLRWLAFSESRQPFRAVYIDCIPILNRPSSPEREHFGWNDKIASAWRECEARKLARHLRARYDDAWTDLARSAKRLNLPRCKGPCSSCTGCSRNGTLNIFLRLEDTRWLWWNLYSLEGTNATWQNSGADALSEFVKWDAHNFHIIDVTIMEKLPSENKLSLLTSCYREAVLISWRFSRFRDKEEY